MRLGFMSFFVKACDRGAAALPGRQCVGRRQRHRLPRVLRHRHRRLDGTRPDRAGAARCGPAGLSARSRSRSSGYAHARARRRADARGTDRRHVHDHQRRRVRLAAVDADPEPAAERDPRHAQDPGAARRRRRPGRRAPDDVPRADLRSPASSTAGKPCSSWSPIKDCAGGSGAACCCRSEVGVPMSDTAYDVDRHRRRPGRLSLRDPRGAEQAQGRLHRRVEEPRRHLRLRRHLPQRRLHSVEGAARVVRAVSPRARGVRGARHLGDGPRVRRRDHAEAQGGHRQGVDAGHPGAVQGRGRHGAAGPRQAAGRQQGRVHRGRRQQAGTRREARRARLGLAADGAASRCPSTASRSSIPGARSSSRRCRSASASSAPA